MSTGKGRSALIGALVVVASALFAQGAQASIAPSISLDQSAGTRAGATQNLGMDLKFPATSLLSTDSPDVMTINLPPGLLANASIDGGACLTTFDISDSNCEVGSGMVSASELGLGVPVTLPVGFYLVPPPAPGDLAGLAVAYYQQQIGATADIKVRSTSDPDGVGITIDFVLPNSLSGLPIQVTDINSTFDGLRYPTTCPSTPARVSVGVDSYQDSTVHDISAPLSVTGCSSLPYAPKLSLTATKDRSDRNVGIATSVTQAADESPSRSLTLAFTGATMGVNLASVRLLCGNVQTGNCTPVGVATATSPDYPKPLTANAYLTGTALGPSLTLVFPAPFPLTLTGSVSLSTLTTTFNGLPDIPLTSLALDLNGGPTGLFLTNCNPGDGVVNASSTDQNGDKSVSAAVKYSIVGCAASSHSSTSGGTNSPPSLVSPAATGLKTGHPSITFRVAVKHKAAKLTALTVKVPRGLRFVGHGAGKHLKITGVAVGGTVIRSLAISGGRLVISFRKPARAVTVKLTSVLQESSGLIAAARTGKATKLKLTVVALNTRNQRHTLIKTIKLIGG
jgi:hypothetical protein